MINTEAQLSLSSTGGSLLSKMAIQETNVEVTFVGWRCRTPKDPFPTDFCSGQKAIGDCNSERPNKGKSPHNHKCQTIKIRLHGKQNRFIKCWLLHTLLNVTSFL